MKIYKRIKLLIPALSVFLLPLAVRAQSARDAVCGPLEDLGGCGGADDITGSSGLISNIVQTLVIVVGSISVIVIVVAGLMYVISAGDSAGVNRAKNAIIYALAGLVVAVMAQVIVSFVLTAI